MFETFVKLLAACSFSKAGKLRKVTENIRKCNGCGLGKTSNKIILALCIETMNLQNTKSLYDYFLEYNVQLMKTISIQAIFIICVGSGIVILCYVIYYIYKYRHKKNKHFPKCSTNSQKTEDNYHSSMRTRSVIGHKQMLRELEHAADNCCEKKYALKCIDIVVFCPYLINIRYDARGLTPFHRICLRGHACLIEFMLKKGADPFLTTKTGENALCMAIYHYLHNPGNLNFSCLDILQNAGCNLGSNNKWYHFFLKMAVTNNQTKLAEWLVVHHNTLTYRTLRCSSI